MTTKTSKTAKVEQDRPFRTNEWNRTLSGRLSFDSIALCLLPARFFRTIWGLPPGPHARYISDWLLASLDAFSISILGSPPIFISSLSLSTSITIC